MGNPSINRLIEQLERFPADSNILEYSLDKIVQQASPELGFLLRACAIPHWFDVSIVGNLRQKEYEIDINKALVSQISKYAFVQTRLDGAFAYHEEVRSYFLKTWRTNHNVDEYRRLSDVLARYFHHLCDESGAFAKSHSSQNIIQNGFSREIDCLVESIFHKMIADEPTALRQLSDLFWNLDLQSDYGACQYLTDVLKENMDFLSKETRLWLQYYDAHNLVKSENWTQAKTDLESLIENAQSTRVYSWILVDLARVQTAFGLTELSFSLYDEALTSAIQVADESSIARIKGSLGNRYSALKNYKEAIKCYNVALEINRRIGNNSREMEQLRNLGSVEARLCHWVNSENYFRESLILSQKNNDRTAEGWALDSLGTLFELQEKWDGSLSYYNHALSIFDDLNQPGNKGYSLGNIGDVYSSINEWHKAESYYRQAVKEFQKAHIRSAAAMMLGRIAKLQTSQQKWIEAIQTYTECRNLYQELKQLG